MLLENETRALLICTSSDAQRSKHIVLLPTEYKEAGDQFTCSLRHQQAARVITGGPLDNEGTMGLRLSHRDRASLKGAEARERRRAITSSRSTAGTGPRLGPTHGLILRSGPVKGPFRGPWGSGVAVARCRWDRGRPLGLGPRSRSMVTATGTLRCLLAREARPHSRAA